MKILITGATGFIGKTLIPHILEKGGHWVSLIVRDRAKAQSMFGNLDVAYIMVDDAMRQNIIDFNPDAVIHLAAYFTTSDVESQIKELIDSNILFTTRLLESLKHTQCRYFINTGTFTESLHGSGDPVPANLYSATKAACRPIIRYFQQVSGWKWINVVVYSPYGRRPIKKKVIDYLTDALNAKTAVAFTEGTQRLDFIHVDDIVDFYDVLLQKLDTIKEDCVEFHLGTGKAASIREVAQIMEKVSGGIVNADWGKLPGNPMNPIHAVASVSYTVATLGWQPKIDLETGIRILLQELNRIGE